MFSFETFKAEDQAKADKLGKIHSSVSDVAAKHLVPEVSTFIRKLLYFGWVLILKFLKICIYCLLIGLMSSRVTCIIIFYSISVKIHTLNNKQNTYIKINAYHRLKSTLTVKHLLKYCDECIVYVVPYFPPVDMNVSIYSLWHMGQQVLLLHWTSEKCLKMGESMFSCLTIWTYWPHTWWANLIPLRAFKTKKKTSFDYKFLTWKDMAFWRSSWSVHNHITHWVITCRIFSQYQAQSNRPFYRLCCVYFFQVSLQCM